MNFFNSITTDRLTSTYIIAECLQTSVQQLYLFDFNICSICKNIVHAFEDIMCDVWSDTGLYCEVLAYLQIPTVPYIIIHS